MKNNINRINYVLLDLKIIKKNIRLYKTKNI